MKNLRRLACKFDLNQSERKSKQAHASPGQTKSQVDPSLQLASTCVNLRLCLARALEIARLYKRIVSRTELRPVSFNKRQQNENHFSRNIHGAACFPNVFQFPIQETLFPVSVFVFKMQIMLTLHGREF